jgi:TRAP-type C4-dicarboxylate transport system permease small subunit
MMSRVLAWLEWLLNAIGAALVAVILVAVCIQIVMRYVFDNATLWSDPVASASLAWLTFIAMTAAVRSDSNMSVRFTWNWLGDRGKRVAETISLVSSAGFAVALAVSAWQLMQATDTALVEGLPFNVTWAQMYSITLVSAAFIAVFVIEGLLRIWAGDR